MKILIDGQTLLTPEINRGIGKYFLNTVENILSCDFVNDFYINLSSRRDLDSFSPWARGKLHVLENEARTGNGNPGTSDGLALRYSDRVNELIERTGIDLYWSPNALMDNVFLPVPRTDRCEFAVTIFDLIPFVMEQHYRQNWPPEIFKRYRAKLTLLESDYNLFLHISQHTCDDFKRMLRVDQKTHVVTPLAAGDLFRPYPFPRVPDVKDYVLYPGGFDPRKNMIGALEAFAELHTRHGGNGTVSATRLVIVCHVDESSEKDIRQRAESLGIGDKLELTGFVTDAELVHLYQKARCLFFPSLYEGFGLPVLEGLACGLPVATSNSSSIPEVAGDLALYFDPLNIDEMAEVLYHALNEPIDVESRRRRYDYSTKFSWQKTAIATLRAFNGRVNGLSEPFEPGTNYE